MMRVDSPLVPDQPKVDLTYLSAPPLCSHHLHLLIANEYQHGPPPTPSWRAFVMVAAPDFPARPLLWDVIASLSAFLLPSDLRSVACVALDFCPGLLFTDVQVFPPWPPLHSRLFGARKRSPLRCTWHDKPSPFLVFHHC
jgi:hypothetical protein